MACFSEGFGPTGPYVVPGDDKRSVCGRQSYTTLSNLKGSKLYCSSWSKCIFTMMGNDDQKVNLDDSAKVI